MPEWSSTLNTRLARSAASAWYSVDIRYSSNCAMPYTRAAAKRMPPPSATDFTMRSTRAATARPAPTPWVTALKISSPKVYSRTGFLPERLMSSRISGDTLAAAAAALGESSGWVRRMLGIASSFACG